MKTLEDKYKPMVFKDLRKIWLKWLDGTFHESNTLLLDDSPYKALLNPVRLSITFFFTHSLISLPITYLFIFFTLFILQKNTAIFPLSYSYKDRNDDFLGMICYALFGLWIMVELEFMIPFRRFFVC